MCAVLGGNLRLPCCPPPALFGQRGKLPSWLCPLGMTTVFGIFEASELHSAFLVKGIFIKVVTGFGIDIMLHSDRDEKYNVQGKAMCI